MEMYPNQSRYHFNVGSVMWDVKMHIKKLLLQKNCKYNSLVLILQRHIQVLNFIHYEQCQTADCYVMDFFR